MSVGSLSLQKNIINMPRPFRNRKVCYPPQMSGFKPFGIPFCESECVKLQFDEYESIKLVNYEKLSQEIAAEKMNVSRPTFTRIYNSALTKIAKSFVECLSIEIIGGNVEFENEYFECKKCKSYTDEVIGNERCKNCKHNKYN